MRETTFVLGIKEVEVLGANLSHFLPFVDWLSATAYASSRTSHYLYEVIMNFSFIDAIQKSSCIPKSADCCSSNCYIIDLEICFLYSLILIKSGTSYSFKCIFRWILTFKQIVCSSKSCLHYTSCCSENYTCSCSILHWPVTVNICKCIRTDMR